MSIEIKGPKFNLQLWADSNISLLRRNGTGRQTDTGEFNLSPHDGVQFCNLEGPRKGGINDALILCSVKESAPWAQGCSGSVVMDRQGRPYQRTGKDIV